jgi:predicted kinase
VLQQRARPTPVLVVTGSPGAGKTTVSRALAASSKRGVHLEGDAFYRFLPHLIAPTLPESRAQNTIIIQAIMRAAVAYGAGGYEVVVDGIFGPWFLPVVADELAPAGAPVDYVILRLDEERAVRRAAERASYPGEASMVRQMNAAFAAVGDHERHVIEVGDRTARDIVDEVARRQARGDFRLDLALLRRTEPA